MVKKQTKKKVYRYASGLEHEYTLDEIIFSKKFETKAQARAHLIKIDKFVETTEGEDDDVWILYGLSVYLEAVVYKKVGKNKWKQIEDHVPNGGFDKFDGEVLDIHMINKPFPKHLPIKPNVYMLGVGDENHGEAVAYRKFYRSLVGAISGIEQMKKFLNSKKQSEFDMYDLEKNEYIVSISRTDKNAKYSMDYIVIGVYYRSMDKTEWKYQGYERRQTKEEKQILKKLKLIK